METKCMKVKTRKEMKEAGLTDKDILKERKVIKY